MDLINKHGEQGGELVTIIREDERRSDSWFLLYFKREIEPSYGSEDL